MMFWIGLCVGLIIWMIACGFMNPIIQDDDKFTVFSAGIFGLIYCGIVVTVRFFHRLFISLNRRYTLCLRIGKELNYKETLMVSNSLLETFNKSDYHNPAIYTFAIIPNPTKTQLNFYWNQRVKNMSDFAKRGLSTNYMNNYKKSA